MKKIYIILSHTGTALSQIIKKYTKDEFSHVSISLDEGLMEMYSFGRLKPYNPFKGGFVHERINKGTFRRFKKTVSKIYFLEVTDEQYEVIKNEINKVKKARREYKFNVIGLFAVGLNIKLKGEKTFYCAEFVKYILERAQIDTNLPEIVRPENFKDLYGIKEIYSGLLREYKIDKVEIKKV